jgi:hypothetical protein
MCFVFVCNVFWVEFQRYGGGGGTNETNTRYTNERTIRKTQTNERTIHERTNHWSITIYYPMTNDPGSIEVQYSIVLLFE